MFSCLSRKSGVCAGARTMLLIASITSARGEKIALRHCRSCTFMISTLSMTQTCGTRESTWRSRCTPTRPAYLAQMQRGYWCSKPQSISVTPTLERSTTRSCKPKRKRALKVRRRRVRTRRCAGCTRMVAAPPQWTERLQGSRSYMTSRSASKKASSWATGAICSLYLALFASRILLLVKIATALLLAMRRGAQCSSLVYHRQRCSAVLAGTMASTRVVLPLLSVWQSHCALLMAPCCEVQVPLVTWQSQYRTLVTGSMPNMQGPSLLGSSHARHERSREASPPCAPLRVS